MHPSLSLSLGQKQASRSNLGTLHPLDMLSVFEATGVDTLTFLQGQLTNDIVTPGQTQSRLAGYCTAQGRLLATMILGEVPNAEGVPKVHGLIRTDIVASVLKRLNMFVLRAKVTLAPTELSVVGVTVSETGQASLAHALNHALPDLPWQTVHTATGTWIAAPSADSSMRRWWWIAGAAHQQALETLGLVWNLAQSAEWESLDIQAGLPWIEARTQDLFIPQTLNLDLIEGVSFTKGCYPGQEIVARSHYRGTVKKRMALGTVSSTVSSTANEPLIASADIFDGEHAEQPCGRLINVATTTQADCTVQWLLFESSFDAYDHQQLKALSAKGPTIDTRPLPYSTRPEANAASL